MTKQTIEREPLDVWLRFEHPDDEEPTHEANTYENGDDGGVVIEHYHTAVGLVTAVWHPTYESAKQWYAAHGYDDYSSGTEYTAADVREGDIIVLPSGATRHLERVIVHWLHRYDGGELVVRYRYLSNPRGIDWSTFVHADEPGLKLLSRGVAHVDESLRTLLP